MTYPVPIAIQVATANDFARACCARSQAGDPAPAMERPLLVQTLLREHRIREDVILGAAVLHRLLGQGLAERSVMADLLGTQMTDLAVQVAGLTGRTWGSQAVRVRKLDMPVRKILAAELIIELESMPAGAWCEQRGLATQARRLGRALCPFVMPISISMRLMWGIERLVGTAPPPSHQGGRFMVREEVEGAWPPPSATSLSGRYPAQQSLAPDGSDYGFTCGDPLDRIETP